MCIRDRVDLFSLDKCDAIRKAFRLYHVFDVAFHCDAVDGVGERLGDRCLDVYKRQGQQFLRLVHVGGVAHVNRVDLLDGHTGETLQAILPLTIVYVCLLYTSRCV